MGMMLDMMLAGERLAAQAYQITLHQLQRLKGLKASHYTEYSDAIDEDIQNAENRLKMITSVLEGRRLWK